MNERGQKSVLSEYWNLDEERERASTASAEEHVDWQRQSAAPEAEAALLSEPSGFLFGHVGPNQNNNQIKNHDSSGTSDTLFLLMKPLLSKRHRDVLRIQSKAHMHIYSISYAHFFSSRSFFSFDVSAAVY